MASECSQEFTESAVQNELSISVETADEPIWIEGDSMRLFQCLSNLLNNAIKFTDPGGRIVVTVEMEPGSSRALLKVKDTGAGMTEEELFNVFTAFHQGSSAKRLSKDGLGLGLAVLKEISQLHGGEVFAESPGAGEGSTFIIALPTCEPPIAVEEDCEDDACGEQGKYESSSSRR